MLEREKRRKKYTCNIYCVSETMTFIWSASKTVWISVTMKLIFPGRIFLSPLNKRAPIVGRTERLPCFFTIEAPLLSSKNGSSRLRHKRSPLSATQCALSPYLVLPLTVCPVCELSWSQCSQLIKKKKKPFNFLFFSFYFFFDLTLSELSAQEGGEDSVPT